MYTCTELGIGPERRKVFEDLHRFADKRGEEFILEVPKEKPFIKAFSSYLNFIACNNIGVVLELNDGTLMIFHSQRDGMRGSCEVYKYETKEVQIPWSDQFLRFNEQIAAIPNITLYRQISDNKWKMVI